MVDEYLHSLEFSLPTNAVYILDGTRIQEEGAEWSSAQGLRQGRMGQGNKEQGDCDEYYDGFRCLYNEEVTAGAEGHNDADFQKNASPCPPLHPAVN